MTQAEIHDPNSSNKPTEFIDQPEQNSNSQIDLNNQETSENSTDLDRERFLQTNPIIQDNSAFVLQKAEEIVASAGSNVLKTNRPWHRRKRWYCLVLILIFIWFSLVPSPVKITRESHHYVQPRYNNGSRVDYEKIYYDLQEQYLSKPEENGFRDILAAMGPRVLEQAVLTQIPWSQMPSNKMSKNWWYRNWLPLCEKLQIDPYPQPEYLDYVPLEVWLIINGIQGNEPILEKKQCNIYVNCQPAPERVSYQKARNVVKKQILQRPWTDQEFPQAGQWLKRFDPLLDLFQKSVRKPIYSSFHSSSDNGSHNLLMVLLPDIQAQHELMNAVRTRINHRLALKDLDGAIDDLIGIYYLSDRMKKGVRCAVEYSVGNAILYAALEETVLLLQFGNLSKDQMARLNREYNSIGLNRDQSVFYGQKFNTEFLIQLSGFQFVLDNPNELRKDKKEESYFFVRDYDVTWDERWVIFRLPIDKNIAMKRAQDYLCRIKNICSQKDYSEYEQSFHDLLKSFDDLKVENRNWKYFTSLFFIRKRSQIYTDLAIVKTISSMKQFLESMTKEKTNRQLIQTGIALDRFYLDKDRYPSELNELVPDYLRELPADPFVREKTLVYKYNDQSKQYALYSVGLNQQDDGGKNNFKEKNSADDIVFDRFGKYKEALLK